MLALLDRLTPDKRVLVGLILGLVLLMPSALLRSLALGRWLADPLPLLLSLGQLFRGGLAQFNWLSPLIFLLYSLGAILLSVGVAHRLSWRHEEDAGVIARTVMLLNVGVIVLLETDAVMVGIWYLLALVLSMTLAASVATVLSWLLAKRPASLEVTSR